MASKQLAVMVLRVFCKLSYKGPFLPSNMSVLFFLILFAHLKLTAQVTVERISPVRFKENIHLAGYEVNQTYKFSETEYFVIAEGNSEEGFRLIYLQKAPNSKRFRIKFTSAGKGEAYVYNPYFYQYDNKKSIIVVEEGYEYMSGIDIYMLKEGRIKYIGYVPVSGDNRDSVIPNLRIKELVDHFEIIFSGKIEYEIATDRIINGSDLKVEFEWDRFDILEN